jgi:hypothetical protein
MKKLLGYNLKQKTERLIHYDKKIVIILQISVILPIDRKQLKEKIKL